MSEKTGEAVVLEALWKMNEFLFLGEVPRQIVDFDDWEDAASDRFLATNVGHVVGKARGGSWGFDRGGNNGCGETT